MGTHAALAAITSLHPDGRAGAGESADDIVRAGSWASYFPRLSSCKASPADDAHEALASRRARGNWKDQNIIQRMRTSILVLDRFGQIRLPTPLPSFYMARPKPRFRSGNAQPYCPGAQAGPGRWQDPHSALSRSSPHHLAAAAGQFHSAGPGAGRPDPCVHRGHEQSHPAGPANETGTLGRLLPASPKPQPIGCNQPRGNMEEEART